MINRHLILSIVLPTLIISLMASCSTSEPEQVTNGSPAIRPAPMVQQDPPAVTPNQIFLSPNASTPIIVPTTQKTLESAAGARPALDTLEPPTMTEDATNASNMANASNSILTQNGDAEAAGVAALLGTIPIYVQPLGKLSIDPSYGVGGTDFTIELTEFVANSEVTLHLYRYREACESYNYGCYQYVATLPPITVDENGKATYILSTRPGDPVGQYVVYRNAVVPVSRSFLLCPPFDPEQNTVCDVAQDGSIDLLPVASKTTEDVTPELLTNTPEPEGETTELPTNIPELAEDTPESPTNTPEPAENTPELPTSVLEPLPTDMPELPTDTSEPSPTNMPALPTSALEPLPTDTLEPPTNTPESSPTNTPEPLPTETPTPLIPTATPVPPTEIPPPPTDTPAPPPDIPTPLPPLIPEPLPTAPPPEEG